MKNKKDPNRLVTPDGGFKSEFPGGKGKGYSIGYLEEVCEWLYHHDNMTDEEKLKKILSIEKIIKDMLNSGEIMGKGIPIKYIPTWSTKLNKKLK